MNGDIIGDVQAMLYGRAFFYKLTHVVFGGKPDTALFETLSCDACKDTLTGLAAFDDAIGSVVRYSEHLDDIAFLERALEKSVSEYNRVVLGLGANHTAFPWESYYTSDKNLLFQVETLAVRDAYREFGYLPEMYMKVADDHLAIECAFMAALAQKSIDAYERDDREEVARLFDGQLRFVTEHLMKWVGRFADDLRTDSPEGLYALLASALESFLVYDEKFLRGQS